MNFLLAAFNHVKEWGYSQIIDIVFLLKLLKYFISYNFNVLVNYIDT